MVTFVNTATGEIHEGLVATYRPSVLVNLLNRWPDPGVHVESDGEGTVMISFFLPYDLTFIEHLADSAGYYLASWRLKGTIKKGPWNAEAKLSFEKWPPATNQEGIVVMEAKYDMEAYPTPEVGYHATRTASLPSIEKYGLLPQAGGKKATYPDRIYLAYREDSAHALSPELGKNEPSTILKVNLKGLAGLVARIDRDFPKQGFYINKNVPPNRIEVLSAAKKAEFPSLPDPSVKAVESPFLAKMHGPHSRLP